MRRILLGFSMALAACGAETETAHAADPIDKAGRHNEPIQRVSVYSYNVTATYPHSEQDFTQGLFFADGVLYESTGQVGESALIRHPHFGGAEETRQALPAHVFGEGAVAVDGKIISLTWRSGTGHVHDLETLELVKTFSYPGEGWGLTYDGTQLIMSDGTNRLRFLDPTTFEETGSISVKVGNKPLPQLNELEWIDGEVWANIWQTDVIARIDPKSGQVLSFVNLSGLFPENHNTLDHVLNGIAYNPETDKLYVTGKRWPNLFEIELKRIR